MKITPSCSWLLLIFFDLLRQEQTFKTEDEAEGKRTEWISRAEEPVCCSCKRHEDNPYQQ